MAASLDCIQQRTNQTLVKHLHRSERTVNPVGLATPNFPRFAVIIMHQHSSYWRSIVRMWRWYYGSDIERMAPCIE